MPRRTITRLPRFALPAVALVLGLGCAAAFAQQGVERQILLRHDLDVPGHEAVLAQVSIAPGGREGRHTHPGSGVAHVLSGALTVEMDGEPVRTLVAGDSLFIDAGRVHEGINNGSEPVKLLATFIVEKGKPLSAASP